MIVHNDKQVSAVLYLLPFTSHGFEVVGDTFVIDDHLILHEDIRSLNAYRNLVRSDIKWCIGNLSIYSLFQRGEEGKSLSIKSFATTVVRNDKYEVIAKECHETNLGDILKVRNMYVYRFDNDNQFLVLGCMLDDPEAKVGRPIEDLVAAHSHFMNNYFKKPDGYTFVDDEVVDITKDDRNISSYIQLVFNDGEHEYTYSLNSNNGLSISKPNGIQFDFNNYHVRVLAQMMLFDKEYDKKLLLNQICSGAKHPMLKRKDEDYFDTNRLLSLSNCFGSMLLYWREDDETDEAWDKRNRSTVYSFYNEFLYDFLVALNYHIRVEKQINRIGRLNYDAKDSGELRLILHELNQYKKNAVKYYFTNVSRLDYVNAYYQSLVRGLHTEELDRELETKLRNATEYLTARMESSIRKENRLSNTLIAIVAVGANVGLFILALLQVATAITDQISIWVVVALYVSLGIAVAAIVVSLALYFHKRKINKKYGKE